MATSDEAAPAPPPVRDGETTEAEMAQAADELAQAVADQRQDDARFLKLIPNVLEELRLLDSAGEARSDGIRESVTDARDIAYLGILRRLHRIAGRDLPAR